MAKKPSYEELEFKIKQLEEAEIQNAQLHMALLQSETRFRLLYEKAPVSYQSLNESGHFIEVNQAWLETLGYKKDDVIGRSFGDFLHPDWTDHFRDNFSKFKAVGEVLGVEFEMIKKDGTPILVSFHGNIGKDENGNFKQTHCILDDITELRRTQNALAESENQLQTLVNTIPDLVWLKDKDGVYLGCNKAFEQFFGATAAEIVSRTDYDFVDKELADFFRMHDKKAMETNQKTINEEQLTFAAIDYTGIFETIKMPMHDSRGKLIGVLGIARDISERKKTEQILKVNEQRYKSAQRLGQVGNWEYDLKTKKIWASEQAKRMYELNPDSIYFTADEVERCMLEKEKVRRAFVDLLEKSKPYDLIVEIEPPNSHRRKIIRSIAEVIHDENGTPQKVTGVVLDITKSRKAENALRESEERLQLIIKGSNDAPWDWDLALNELYYSPQWWAQLGYQPDVLPADAELWRRLMHPDDEDIVNEVFDNVMKNGHDSYEVEFRMQHKNGHYVYLLSRGYVTRDTNGTPIRVTGTNMDLTERKKAEEELRLSEMRFKQLIEKSPLPMVITDHNHNPIFINFKFTELFGYTLEDISTAELWWQNAYPNVNYRKTVQNSWIKAIAEATAMKRDVEVQEWELTTKDGPQKTSEFYMMPMDDIGLTVMNDVTERKQIENELKVKNAAIESSLNGFDIVDENGKFIYVNAAYVQMFGYNSAEEILGSTPAAHCFDPEIPEKIIQTLKKKGEYEFEFKAKRKDGSLFDVLMYTQLTHDEHGREIYTGTSIDITEKKQLHNQLQHAQKLESIGNLAGGIAHEFNNILSIIIGNNELIMDDLPDESLAKESAEEIRMAGLRARDVVKQLLTFSRQDDVEKSVIDIQPIVKESLKLVRTTIPKNIVIETSISDNIHHIFGSATQINQILLNLCNNAYDAIQVEKGRINVVLENLLLDNSDITSELSAAVSSYVHLQVSDNGAGMTEDITSKIFDPYFTTKTVGKGTGIGLAVVHGIVKAHGGNISVKSKPGAGTTFSILFPASASPLSEEKTTGELSLGGTEKILFVDDEPNICTLNRRRLENLGYSVTTHTDPQKALSAFAASPGSFDLLITDMAMPGMTGKHLIDAVRKIRNDIPTMICTGYSENLSEKDAHNLGIGAFLMKPVDKHDLAESIRKILVAK